MTVAITDVVLRDAHRSLFATRLPRRYAPRRRSARRRGLLVPSECWGGRHADACIRFLGRDPGPPAQSKAVPKAPCRCCSRPEPPRRYRHYADDVVGASLSAPSKTAWTCSTRRSSTMPVMKAALPGAQPRRSCPGTLSYHHQSDPPCRRLDLTSTTAETGVDSIAIKDMSGILTPRPRTLRWSAKSKT